MVLLKLRSGNSFKPRRIVVWGTGLLFPRLFLLGQGWRGRWLVATPAAFEVFGHRKEARFGHVRS